MSDVFTVSGAVELPAVVAISSDGTNGTIKLCTPAMATLSAARLQSIADLMHGRIVWLKMEALYTESIHAFCRQKECWSLAKSTDGKENGEYCEDHL